MRIRCVIAASALVAFAFGASAHGAGAQKKKPRAGAKTAADSAPAVPAAERWRSERPASGPSPIPVLPTFERAVLDNGLTVLVAKVDALPLVSFALVTMGGAALDPPDGAGLGSLMYGMLDEGAGDLDALAFADAIADLGAAYHARCDRDHGVLEIGGLSRHRDAMLRLLALAARKPTFANKDFERTRSQQVANLVQEKSSAKGMAMQAFPALIYGADHPFGHAPNGTVESVERLSLEAVQKHHARIMDPRRSALIAAGNITLGDAKRLAGAHLGDWTNATPDVPRIPAVTAKPRTEVVIVHKSPAPQTVIAVGMPIFGRGHPDEWALALANDVFGGSFSSRLNMNLREDKGYTYGASSQTTHRSEVGAFSILTDVRRDATAESLREIFAEIARLRSKQPTDDEVTRARRGLVRALPGAFERTSAIAAAASTLFVYDFPLDWYANLAQKYESTTTENVNAAIDRHLDAATMQVLLVGDAEAIEKSVAKVGLGAVVVRR